MDDVVFYIVPLVVKPIPMLFRKFYRCERCSNEWADVWSAKCDDDCSRCGARHMSPYKSEDADDGEAADHVS
jgi:DNA-directed RNA polymerase subunit RPC12/RpoP